MDIRAILKHGHRYYFYDYPEDDFPDRDKIVRIVDAGNPTGSHACKRSFLYDDMTGYVDALQDEEKLPDGHYIVAYFSKCDRDLVQLVDWDISKEQIIQNVIAQRYVEGADYYLMDTEDDQIRFRRKMWSYMCECLSNEENNLEIWSDASEEILVPTKDAAYMIADFLLTLGFDTHVHYYDPAEDERNNEMDSHTGWWYIDYD